MVGTAVGAGVETTWIGGGGIDIVEKVDGADVVDCVNGTCDVVLVAKVVIGQASAIELVSGGCWLDSDVALRQEVVVAVAVVVNRLTDKEVLPPLVTVTNVPRSEFVLLRVANEIKVDEVEKEVGFTRPGVRNVNVGCNANCRRVRTSCCSTVEGTIRCAIAGEA